ncbi:MAG: flagellar assembly protein FliX [Lactobacillus sp.]|nr:flagellar assembly protein FliX [Lactobacillus sp.]
MLRVGDIKKTESTSSGKVKKSSGGSNFSSYLTSGVSEQDSSIKATSSISVTGAIFSAQMVDGEEEREIRKHLMKRSETLIEKLEEIRDGLLLGYISRDKLIEISRFVKERRFNTDDEKLKSIIEEIELRIEVELAKLMK